MGTRLKRYLDQYRERASQHHVADVTTNTNYSAKCQNTVVALREAQVPHYKGIVYDARTSE